MGLAAAKAVADLIFKFGPVVIEAGRSIRQWKKREALPQGDPAARLDRIEEFIALQTKLNEQHIEELRALAPALERMQRTMTVLFALAVAACAIAIFAVASLVARP